MDQGYISRLPGDLAEASEGDLVCLIENGNTKVQCPFFLLFTFIKWGRIKSIKMFLFTFPKC